MSRCIANSIDKKKPNRLITWNGVYITANVETNTIHNKITAKVYANRLLYHVRKINSVLNVQDAWLPLMLFSWTCPCESMWGQIRVELQYNRLTDRHRHPLQNNNAQAM